MANPSPNAPKLRVALDWWRNAARTNLPPTEADFVSEDPKRYAGLLADAFIVDALADGALVFRFVGTELSDYVGWGVPGQRIDVATIGKELSLIRDVLARTIESLSPHLARGRIASASDTGAFEAICLPLVTATGTSTFFGAVAREGHWRLPPAPQNHRVDVEAVLDLGSSSSNGRNGAEDGEPSQRTAGLNPSPRGA
jgi:hypothetical protein